jgi:hypothetical protein
MSKVALALALALVALAGRGAAWEFSEPAALHAALEENVESLVTCT